MADRLDLLADQMGDRLDLLAAEEEDDRLDILSAKVGYDPAILESAHEDVDLAEQVRAGKISASELPPEVRRDLGIMLPGDYMQVGLLPMQYRGEEAEVTPVTKIKEKIVESPKVLAGLEGLGYGLGQFGLVDPEKATIPTIEQTYDREKTLVEKGIKGAAQLAPEFLAISALAPMAEAIPVLRATQGAKLALRSLKSAGRLGATGMVYESAREFGNQVLDPEVNVDLGKILRAGGEGLLMWGTMGATGPTLGVGGRFAGRNIAKIVGKMSPFGRFKLRINGLGMTLKRTGPLKRYGGREMWRIDGPEVGGKRITKMFGDLKTAKQWVRIAEKGEIAKHLELSNWQRYHTAWNNANKRMRARVFETAGVKHQGFERLYHTVAGGVHYLAQRIENNIFSTAAVAQFTKRLRGLGLTEAGIKATKEKVYTKLGVYRLWSNLVKPILNADRLARRYNERMGKWISRNVDQVVHRLSKDWGRSELQVSEDALDLLVSRPGNFTILADTVRNHIASWRHVYKSAESAIGGLEEVNGHIKKFALQYGVPKKARAELLKWVTQSRKTPAVATIEKKLGTFLSGKGRTKAYWAQRYGNQLVRANIVKDFANPADGQIYLNELDKIVAKSSKAFNHMFRSAGLDPSIWRAHYAPHLRSTTDVSFREALKGVPKWVRPKYKFFAEMHNKDGNFVADRDIRSLLQKYTWGSGRHRYMKDVLERGQALVHSMSPSDPIRQIFIKFTNDVITGTDTALRNSLVRSIETMTEGKIPFEVTADWVDTMMATIYGGALGFRPWLIARNAIQPAVTTNVTLAGHPTALARAYLQAMKGVVWKVAGKVIKPSGKYWDDFFAQGVHMRRGRGLPMGEEFFREMSVSTPEGESWKAMVKAMGAWRSFAFLSTHGYRLADTLNRFVSYRAMINAINSGLKSRAAKKLSKYVYTSIQALPKKPLRGKLTAKDVAAAKGKLVNTIVESAQMNKFLGATGVRAAFHEQSGFRGFARPIVEHLLESTIKGKGAKAQEIFKFAQSPKTLHKAMKSIVQGGPVGDSLSRSMGRQLVAETQWLYQRNVQPTLVQNRIFGTFQTWSANYIEFLRRTLSIGNASDIAAKTTMLGVTTGGLVAGLKAAHISPWWVAQQFVIPLGGPFIDALIQVRTLLQSIGRGDSTYTEFEVEKAVGKLANIPKSLGYPGASEVRSIVQGIQGKKPMFHGVLGAPYQEPPQKVMSFYQGKRDWDMSKLTDSRVKRISNLLVRMDKANTDQNEQLYGQLYHKLREEVRPVTKYLAEDVVKVAGKLVKSHRINTK